jgi:hypothetical protein
VLSDVDWDSKLSGGQLCLYHMPTGRQGKACGEQATLVSPAGDTLVIFDSHMEHEVFPSYADRCRDLQSVSQHLPSIETSLAATSTLPALKLSHCTVMHCLSSRVKSVSQNLHPADEIAKLFHLITLINAHHLWESVTPPTPSRYKIPPQCKNASY